MPLVLMPAMFPSVPLIWVSWPLPVKERETSAQAAGSLLTTQLLSVIEASTAWIALLILMSWWFASI
jgi:hypothetical protein